MFPYQGAANCSLVTRFFFFFFFLMLLYYRCADGFRSTEMAQIDFLFFSFGEWDFDREISMTIQRMMRDLVNRFIEGSLFWRKIGETSNLFYSYENLYLEREIQGDNCHRGSKIFEMYLFSESSISSWYQFRDSPRDSQRGEWRFKL